MWPSTTRLRELLPAESGSRLVAPTVSTPPTVRSASTARSQNSAFRSGVVLPPFDNVDVYPLLAKLVGVAPLPNDGTIRVFSRALAK